ncbi:MAG: glycosyl hydrolase 115 family protein [Phycisphaerae bacterium]|nr:glycosyl hydrolase 115 family protein [Phycisphaerae bacterium]MDD5381037.1 glycosyl hydrolase 115 family protein [Phycisphaerae bacterium]
MRATNWTKIIVVTALCLFLLNLSSCVAPGAKPGVKPEVSITCPHRYVDTVASEGSFQLAKKNELAAIYVDSEDWAGVVRAAGDLRADINRVTGRTPKITNKETTLGKNTVIIGTLGKSKLIDQLVKEVKIDASKIDGKWESFIIAVVPKPLPGVENALVIAGSDKRGTIYGIYDLSEKIGVSPWYWWADVPAEHKDALFIKAGQYIEGPPAVKYRGIFINDEGWALGPWANEKFGGFNNKMYVHMFELLLRLKANHLWPGMWGKYFGEDPMSPKLADEYGIVMGSAHCEPLLFNNDPGARKWVSDTMGKWNYGTNKANICKVLDETVAARGQYENLYTVGLRGVHDTKMEGNIDIKAQVALLEQVFEDQRAILSKYIKKDITDIPQVFVPYKEVQDYLDSGLKVPDDVTIMWSDDNWGNIRRLPNPKDKPRAGGAGVYYHYDFHGGPRSYEWLNTSPIPRVWEQMHLAYQHGADRIWIVNVGDLKPMEFPISFFLDYAWNPDKWPAERLPEYTKLWAEQQFGPEYAVDIADILDKYTKYNGRRKPESLAPDTYSLVNYREAETVVAEYNEIADKAEKIYKSIPAKYKDAYYQLVQYPVAACANLNELYLALGKNRLYEKQGRAATNDMTDKVKELFKKDADLSNYYHKEMANGKWNHIMATTHIGYTSWNPPPKNIMPEVNNITLPKAADMGVAIEGSDSWWPMDNSKAILPEFDLFNQQKYYVEVFNRGQTPFDYKIESAEPWLIVTPNQGKVDKEQRVCVSVDWQKAPAGKNSAAITITGPDNKQVVVNAPINNPASPKPEEVKGFVESNGYVSIEAEHYARAVEAPPVKWLRIPDLSRTLSGITPVPVTSESQKPEGDSPRLEYPMYLFNSGKVEVKVYVCPTQNFLNTGGLRYAVSFDDETPQIVNIHVNDLAVPDWKYPPGWNQAVMENIKITTSEHNIGKPGEHVLKFWMVDPGIVLQKIVVDTGGVKPSYLGPPESYRKGCPVVSPEGCSQGKKP